MGEWMEGRKGGCVGGWMHACMHTFPSLRTDCMGRSTENAGTQEGRIAASDVVARALDLEPHSRVGGRLCHVDQLCDLGHINLSKLLFSCL